MTPSAITPSQPRLRRHVSVRADSATLHGVRMLLRTLLVSSKSSRRGGQQVTSLSSLQPRLKWAADIARLDGRTVPAQRRTTVNATLPTPPLYAYVGLTASPYSLRSDTPEHTPCASAGTETESAGSKWRNRHRRSRRRAGCWSHWSPSHLQTHSSIPKRGLSRPAVRRMLSPKLSPFRLPISMLSGRRTKPS